MAGNVDTSHARRRTIRFANPEEALAEVERIVAADNAGRLRVMGNWTPGQILGHVAAWIDYAYDGFPVAPPPWFIRWFLKRQLQKYLRTGLPAGVRIPRVENGTAGTELYSTAEGADRLRRAMRRIQSPEPAPYDSPAFGAMSHADRIQLNLRHAELHLGFLEYDSAAAPTPTKS